MRRSLLIFLHGSGGDGRALQQFLSSVPLGAAQDYQPFEKLAREEGIDILAPTAEAVPYSPLLGECVPVWFNRATNFLQCGLDDPFEDVEGATKSLEALVALIDKGAKTYDHIFLGGISMGGCLSLHGLRTDLNPKVRGIFSMGSFLVSSSIVLDEKKKLGASSKLPVFMMHGVDDSVTNLEWGKRTATNLLLRGIDVRFESYSDLDHEIGEGELVDLLAWMVDLCDIADSATGRNAPPAARRQQSDDEDLLLLSKTNGIEYEIEPSASKSGEYNIRFLIPSNLAPQLVPLLTARPILACGGIFYLAEDPAGMGVLVTVQSSDPSNLAKEIATRLAFRITSGGELLDACPMS